jgi:hypothetical protein
VSRFKSLDSLLRRLSKACVRCLAISARGLLEEDMKKSKGNDYAQSIYVVDSDECKHPSKKRG